jgi:hypothetical protein
LSYLDFEPLTLFLVALGAALLIRLIAGSTSRSQSLLVRLALCLCVGGAIAVLTLHVCFATGTPMTVQEKIATAALLMGMMGGILFASVYRSGGEGPPPPDDDPRDPPDGPGGDYAYPWWPEFERALRDYERERGRERSREREPSLA